VKGLSDYLSRMMQTIPHSSGTRYAQNIAVNAVVAYYASRSLEKGIQTDIDLQLPSEELKINNVCFIDEDRWCNSSFHKTHLAQY
jgi:hypothetical protein